MHSTYSPSSAYRWTTCTASVPLIAKENPPDVPSEAAERGTFLHMIRAHCISKGHSPERYIGYGEDNHKLTAEDAASLAPGIEDLRAIHCDWLRVEQRVDMGRYVPGCYGTADAIAYDSITHTLYVNDYKSGAGHDVSPVENLQLMLYAAGAIDTFNLPSAARVVLVIDQPLSGGIKVWETTGRHVVGVASWCGEIVRDISAGKTVYTPTDENCRWCPVKAACPAVHKRNLQLFGFAGKEPKLPRKMTARQRSKILKYRTQIEDWLKALHDEAMRDAMAGKNVPGFKVVEGRRGHRRWSDESDAEYELQRMLGEKAYVRKLISPAQAEKVLKEIPSTIQAPGQPILVREDDERPPVVLFGNGE